MIPDLQVQDDASEVSTDPSDLPGLLVRTRDGDGHSSSSSSAGSVHTLGDEMWTALESAIAGRLNIHTGDTDLTENSSLDQQDEATLTNKVDFHQGNW